MFGDYVYKWLEIALDYEISESDYWNMTLAEISRAIESKKRISKRKAQEKASYDYILADLIGRSVSRIYSSGNKMPPIAEAYPSLFEAEEIQRKIADKKTELSIIRFKQFAQSHNDKYKGGGTK